jgi:site-specific recombinase XerD
MKLAQAIQNWLLDLESTNHSSNTISTYKVHLAKLQKYLENAELPTLTKTRLQEFMVWVQKNTMRGRKVSPRTVQSVYDAVKIFCGWAAREGLLKSNLLADMARPKAPADEIRPLTQDEFRRMLAACDFTRPYHNDSTKRNRRATARRDKAILAILIDTGLRASELCALALADVDRTTKRLHILGKGRKRRYVYLTRKAMHYLQKYLTERGEDELAQSENLFVSRGSGRAMSRGQLYHIIRGLGRRVGIADVSVHQLRHTFAIEFLRGGGDVFSLQKLLGHADLKMTSRYISLAAIDAQTVHRRASPGDSWL